MPDREKVIRALEHCSSQDDCDGCPYDGKCGMANPYDGKCGMANGLNADILALLKEQEPVEPKKVNRYIDFDGEGHPYSPETYDCGNCDKELPSKAKFCPWCGRKMKWK